MGSSQNFRRWRTNAQNSIRILTRTPQNWFFIVSGGGPGGVRMIQ